jgi:hypothetical protein
MSAEFIPDYETHGLPSFGVRLPKAAFLLAGSSCLSVLRRVRRSDSAEHNCLRSHGGWIIADVLSHSDSNRYCMGD